MNRAVVFKKGVVFVDKPAGITSFELTEQVKHTLGAGKAGHSGTLDMAVTGVMLIALEEAVKAMPVLVGLAKEYEGVMHVHKDVAAHEIEDACKSFLGKIIQIPPRKSAVKRAPREREIYSFEVLGTEGRDVRFRVLCQSGTYVRKLCSDIGEKLGCGAQMASLRRTRLGPFSIKECVRLEELKPGHVKSLEKVLEETGLRKITVKESFADKIRNGLPLKDEWIEASDRGINKGETIGLYSGKSIIALAKYKERELAKVERVFKF
jgi:H/ACA ribonucleoprotein complex subunit 4